MAKHTMPNGWVHKKRTTYEYWCPKCTDWVYGNGSMILPYNCGCGEYDYNYDRDQYILTKPNHDNKNATKPTGDQSTS